MATVTTFTDGQPVVKLDGNFMGVIENYIDFSATSVSAADVVEVLDVGAGTWVHGVGLRDITAEGATCTVDVGDATDPNGYMDAADLNSANAIDRMYEADAYGEGKYYSSADTIDFTMDHDTDAAVVYVYAICHWPERMAS